MGAPRTKRDLRAFCDARQIALDVSHSRSGRWHVHVDIDAPRSIFRAHDLHNLSLWDGTAAPDWREIGREIEAADFGPCTIPDCEYCEGDEDRG